MSEYQYYEFQAIDRPLTPEEQAEVGSLSSRTDPTPTHAVFTYSYGDFQGDPIDVLAAYYDAMLYMANWGSRRLAFRLPRSVVDPERLAPYSVGDIVAILPYPDHVILDIDFSEREGGGWIDGEGWLSSLVPLRSDVLRGDLRALYLAWLEAALDWMDYEIEADALEPPVPPGLDDLSAPLQAFIDFFELEGDRLAVAVEASPKATLDVALDLEALIAQLSEEERSAYVLRLARGEPHLDLHLKRRLRELAADDPVPDMAAPQRRVGELFEAVQARARRRQERRR